MIPRTLSASSLQVASLCLDRWAAEYIDRTPAVDNNAALTGSAVHGALEDFVVAFFIKKTHDVSMSQTQKKSVLETFYLMSFVKVFGHSDTSIPEYADGWELAQKWLKRTDLAAKDMIGVETVEVKETIEVPYNSPDGGQGVIPFNYLMDRVDQISPTEWEVIDYKTVRVPITIEDLEAKIQARAYALALQIKHPEATKIKVTFDLLRHEPVSIFFTRDDNIAFWNFLVDETQRLVDTPREKVRPKLNAECGYCVKKFDCELMTKNIAAGGVHSIPVDNAISLVDQLKMQMKANKIIVENLEEQIMKHAAASEQLEWVTENGELEVQIGVSRRRNFPAQRAAEIMGEQLFAQMGNMTLGNLEKIIKDESVEESVREELKGLIYWANGDLTVKIKPKKKLF